MSQEIILELLAECGIKGRPNGKGELPLSFCCFHEHHFRSPSLSVNIKNGAFYCFACQETGHIRRIFYHNGVEFGDFYNSIKEEGDFTLKLSEALKESILLEDEINAANVTELERFRYFHPYLPTRGYNKEVILSNQIGFDKDTARVTIPIWFNGTYYGCIKRTVLNQLPKYMYPKNLQKSAILYQAKTQKNKHGEIGLWTEGSLDALKSAQYGMPANSILGCIFSHKQLAYFNKTPWFKMVALDNDEPGIKGTQNLLERTGRTDLSIFRYPEGKKDLGELTEDEFKWGVENAYNRLEWILEFSS
jgi:DNA primase